MMQLQKDLSEISLVAKSWNLKLNIDKCVVTRFGAHCTNDNVIFTYNTDGKILVFHLTKILVFWLIHGCSFMNIYGCCSESWRIGGRVMIRCSSLPKFYGVLVCNSY